MFIDFDDQQQYETVVVSVPGPFYISWGKIYDPNNIL